MMSSVPDKNMLLQISQDPQSKRFKISTTIHEVLVNREAVVPLKPHDLEHNSFVVPQHLSSDSVFVFSLSLDQIN
jgi:hypothetical protein